MNIFLITFFMFFCFIPIDRKITSFVGGYCINDTLRMRKIPLNCLAIGYSVILNYSVVPITAELHHLVNYIFPRNLQIEKTTQYARNNINVIALHAHEKEEMNKISYKKKSVTSPN
uniref:uncharacterized protein LOC127065336 n=1 Tax=Vespula vulgaris TaxID=7454 RepID=UPI00213D115B|nr:uncharacterized protein LOC127065336 [Vespula vulgaris]